MALTWRPSGQIIERMKKAKTIHDLLIPKPRHPVGKIENIGKKNAAN